MSMNTVFLFDNREYFLYGEVGAQTVEYIDRAFFNAVQSFRPKAKKVIYALACAAIALGVTFFVNNMVASSAAKVVMKAAAKSGVDYDDGTRKIFIKNREFLGLSQAQVAKMLGLSDSTVEKFEQSATSTQTENTRQRFALFNEWAGVLREFYGDRKFIVRPFITVKMNALGDLSAIEYAMKKPVNGLYDLIGLERKMNG